MTRAALAGVHESGPVASEASLCPELPAQVKNSASLQVRGTFGQL